MSAITIEMNRKHAQAMRAACRAATTVAYHQAHSAFRNGWPRAALMFLNAARLHNEDALHYAKLERQFTPRAL